MTLKNKIKVGLIQTILVGVVIWFVVTIETALHNLSPTEVEVIVHEYDQKMRKSLQPPQESTKQRIEALEKIQELVKLMEPREAVALVRSLTEPEIRFIESFIAIRSDIEINMIAMMFRHLTAFDLKKLLIIAEKLRHQRTMELIDILIQLPEDLQSEIILTLSRLGMHQLTQLFYILNEFDRLELRELFTVLAESGHISALVEVILKLSKDDIMSLVINIQKFSDKDRVVFIDLIKSMDEHIILAIQLLSRIGAVKAINFLDVLRMANEAQKKTFVEVFTKISTDHVNRGFELIQNDTRLFTDGVGFAERLQRRLGEQGSTDTIQRMINTASRVRKDVRHDAMIQLENHRDVSIRRVMKQVDGQQGVYTGNTIEQMSEDYKTLENPDYFINIMSGSQGVTHPASNYGTTSRPVTQERKLFRIQEIYSGNLQHRKERVIEYFDNIPMQIRHTEEQTFEIKPPQTLEENDNL